MSASDTHKVQCKCFIYVHVLLFTSNLYTAEFEPQHHSNTTPQHHKMSNEIILDTSIFADLRGKNVIFTGGASGIGREAVIIFAKAGANVTFGDVNKVEGDKLAAELGR